MPAYFIKYSDETGPKTHEFSSGELILGRAPDCQVVLKDFGISRQHAKLIADPGGVRIMDLGSKNGTKINGNLITQAPLREGDKFSLGSLEILFGKTAEAKVAFDDEPIEASGTIVRSVGDLSKLLAVESKPKPGQTASAASEIARANQILKVLTRVAETLVASRPVDEVLQQVMDIVFESIPAERGFLMLAGEEKDASTLTAKVTKYRHKSNDRGKITISKTIAQRVLSDRVSILTSDALADARFNSGDSIRINQIRSAMVAPLWNREEVIGIIHLDTSALTHAFTEGDLDLLSALANFAAVAIERSRLNEKIAMEEKKRERLGRFLSPQVASRIIATHDSQGFELGEPEVRDVSVLFADIVGFTSLSEKLTPSAIALILNDYLSRMTDAKVLGPITMSPGLATELSRREAVFTVSPSTVYSRLLTEPISPATALPELIPMRIWRRGPALRSALNSARRSRISIAVFTARAAWSGMSRGAPKTAMMASPMYLSSVPSYMNIASVMRDR